MKIVWRNPNPINRTSFSIVKTLAVEHPGELRVFYRSSRGPGALGTLFELMVKCDAVWSAATAALPDCKVEETLHSSHWALDKEHCLSWPLQAAKGSWRDRNRDAKAKEQFAKTFASLT
jgi:hypothetical protein